MEEKKLHIRHILLFLFRKGEGPTEAQRQICAVYGESAIKYKTCQRWFDRFRSGDFELQDAARPGRPAVADDVQILAAVKNNPLSGPCEIAERFGMEPRALLGRLLGLGVTRKDHVWVLVPSLSRRFSQRQKLRDNKKQSMKNVYQ